MCTAESLRRRWCTGVRRTNKVFKLYSLYLIYLPVEKFKYVLKMNVDDRGSFIEIVHTEDCGQVSINVSRTGIMKRI